MGLRARTRTIVAAWLLAVLGATDAAAQPSGLGNAPAPAALYTIEAGTWKAAIVPSIRLATLEHLTRIFVQEKTRAHLGGNFFGDYVRSVSVPPGWHDGDGWRVNYVGHPIHGAAAGFIWLDSTLASTNQSFGSRRYWKTRAGAMVWSAVYSVQFEIGPFSEASLGNVGMDRRTTGWTDYVVTPIGALGLIVAEDAIDRHLIARIESATSSPLLRMLVRMTMNPSRAFANIALNEMPWFRPGRPLR
jgi:hypothetical protein